MPLKKDGISMRPDAIKQRYNIQKVSKIRKSEEDKLNEAQKKKEESRKRKEQRNAEKARKAIEEMPLESTTIRPVDDGKYVCINCGAKLPPNGFFRSRFNPLWNTSEKHVLICRSCLSTMQKAYSQMYGDKATAVILCSILGFFFDERAYATSSKNGSFDLSMYVTQIALVNKIGGPNPQANFITNIVRTINDMGNNDDGDKVVWSKSDRDNKRFVVSTLGYDPFDELDISEADKKYCYNTLAGYIDNGDGTIIEDGHLLQCLVQMTTTLLQSKKIDEQMMQLLKAGNDISSIRNLGHAKTNLLDVVNRMAKDNNISAAYNRESRASKVTITSKMVEMEDNDFWDAKQNLFDVRTCEAMKQVATLSTQAILEQLNLDQNDLAQMVAEQRVMIQNLQNQLDEAEAKNINLQNKLLAEEQKEGG